MTTAEALDLQQRINELQAELEREQAEWDWKAQPIRDRIFRAEDDYRVTGMEADARKARVARRELTMLGPRPVESIRLGGLRSRLWAQEHRS